jgi:purine-binding chemotaxis protein CheW
MEAAQTEQQTADIAAQIGIAGDEDQYLTFMLDGGEYGVDILRVQEIKGWDKVTHIPNTPEFMQGVINLRGAIVPVIDLRQRFGMETLEYGPTTVVVVLRVRSEERERIMGVVVDAVSDVYNIPEKDFRPAPSNGNPAVMDSVRSLATVNEKMVILLDIDHLLNSGELAAMDDAAG